MDERRETDVVDLNFHGIVGLRLVGASVSDTALVKKQIGGLEPELAGHPDVTIRFIDRIRTYPGIRYLGEKETAFTDDAFIIFEKRNTERGHLEVKFGEIGSHCEIVCESGLQGIPLLVPILNVIALSKGALPVHASAFIYNRIGVLVAGWAHGGKTSMLLAFMAQGAQYISDDWAYISPDGRRIYGIAEPISVRHRHLGEVPEYRAVIPRSTRARLRMMKAFSSLGRTLPSSSIVGRIVPLIEQRMFVQALPEALFGRESCALAGNFDKMFLAVSHAKPSVIVERIDSRDVARRLGFALEHERLPLLSYYLKFCFAFPDARNRFIETASDLERELLSQLLAKKDAYIVYHPVSVKPSDLFEAVVPHLTQVAS